jgi:hypothetical protein
MMAMFVGMSAQGKPSFAGRWMLQADPDAAPASRGGNGRGGDARSGAGASRGQFCGVECTITQDAMRLTVVRTSQAGEQRTEYKLDGTETTTTTPAGQLTITSKTKVIWDGSTLAIHTSTGVSGTAVMTKTELSLDPMGRLKVVRTATPPGSAEPGPPGTQTYMRK